MKSKAVSQREHFHRRVSGRFGLELDGEDRRRIIEDIQRGRAKFVDRQSLRVTRWLITREGVEFIVVYDSRRKELVTALPPSWVAGRP